VKAFLDNTQVTVDVLAEGGVVLDTMGYAVEYHATWEGAHNEGGRSLMVVGEDGDRSTVTGGARLHAAFTAACEKLGVEIRTSTPGKRLITRRDDPDGVPEVIGIVAEDENGNEIRIKANKGVLLATGGFEWNDELVTNYLRTPSRYAKSWNSNTGDGLRMVQSVGAELHMMNESWGQACYTKHGEYAKALGIPYAIACQSDRALPGTILVDITGRRFCNEASDYDSQANAMGGYYNFAGNGWSSDPCYLVFDKTCYETYKPGIGSKNGFGVPDIPEEEMIIVADTLEELAEKIGVNGEQLVKTVEEFNMYAKEGIDPIFFRHTTRPIAPVGETLAPLETPPYRAISVSPASTGTVGGPLLNKNAQVMHVFGEPVKGLYAAGNCAGVGAPGPMYGGAGSSIGPGLVMGVIAARHAAGITE